MRLLLPSRDRSHNRQSFGVHDRNSLIQFRCHVQKPSLGIVNRAVWPDAVAEIDRFYYLSGWEVDDNHRVAVRAGSAHTRVSINRNVSGLSIRRRNHFVTRDVSFGYRGDLLSRGCIKDAQVTIPLVSDQYHLILV